MSLPFDRRVVMAVALAVAASVLLPGTGETALVSSTLTPTADAYISSDAQNTNFGTSTQLRIASSPTQTSYLTFNVPALSGPLVSATLRVTPSTSSTTGFQVRAVASNWSETTIKYKGAPTPSTTVTATSTAVTAGTPVDVNITPLVTAGSTVSIALTTTGTSPIVLGSRESANPPQLILQVNDTTAPVVTLAAPANGAVVTTAQPTFSGTGGTASLDGSTVTVNVYAGTTATGPPVQTLAATRAQTGGAYSVTPTAGLADGTYTAQATQSDAAGNVGTSSANTFTVNTARDTTPPVVTLTSPAAASSTNNTKPNFSGVAGTAAGDSTTVTVNVYAGGTATGTPVQTLTATSGANGAYSVPSKKAMTAGTYTARAQQSDTAGNVGFSTANTFVVDITAPVVSLTTPASGATLSTSRPTYAGVAGTQTGDQATVTVQVYQGTLPSGTPVQTLTATRDAQTGAYSVAATTAMADGTYTARAQQSDAATNLGQSTAVTFTVSGAPDTTLTQTPTSPTNQTSATLAFTSTDSQATFQCALDQAGFAACTTPVTLTNLTDGAHTFKVRAVNQAGTPDPTPATTTWTVDTAAPIVTLTAPSGGASLATGRPTYSGVGGTLSGDQASISIQVYQGTSATGAAVQTLTASRDAQTGAYSVTATTPLGDGTYTAQSQQSDAAGNVGSSTATTFTIDTTAPVITLATPASNAGLTTSLPTYSGVAGTASGDQASVTIQVYQGSSATGTAVQTITTGRDAQTGAYSVTATTPLGDGTYTARSQQSDAAGNIGSSTATTFTIDATAPTVSLTAPANGAALATNLPTYSGTGGTQSGDQATVTIQIYQGTTVTATPIQTLTTSRDPQTGSYSTTATTALADGTYTARAQQTDTAGNTGTSATTTYTIDTTAPLITLTTPANNATLTTSKPTYSGVAGTQPGDQATVTIQIYQGTTPTGTPTQTITTSRDPQTGAYSITATTPLPDNTYTARATQTDTATNQGQSTTTTFTTSSPPAGYAGAVLSGAPIGYWRLGECSGTVAADQTSGQHPGTYQNGVTLCVPGAILGDPDTAARFDGVNDQVSMGTAGGAFDVGTGDFSVEAWIRTTTSAGDPAIVSKQQSSQLGWTVSVTDDPGDLGRIRARIFDGTTQRFAYSSVRVDDGKWHQVVVVWNRATGTTIYVDGGQGAFTAGAMTGNANNTGPLLVGAASGYPSFTGDIDEVSLYRSGLSASAVQAHYAAADSVAPVVSLTTPADGAVTASTVPTLAGIAGTAPGDSTTVTVAVYSGSEAEGTPLQTLSANRAADGSYSVPVNTPLPTGSYTAQTTQSDAAGNTGQSAEVNFVVGPSLYRDSVLADNPSGYWRLSESGGTAAADETGNRNTGTYQNGVSLGNPGPIAGDIATSARFDGVDDRVNMGNPASGAFNFGTSDFSAEAWIKTTTTTGDPAIVSKEMGSGLGWTVSVTDDSGVTGRVRLHISDGTTQRYLYSAGRVDDGRWHYVAVVYSHSSGATFYIDGVASSATGTVGSVSNTASLLVGGGPTGYAAFNGGIAEVAVYGRALSSTSVQNHFSHAFTTDTTAPVVTLNSPTNGSTTADSTPMFAGQSGIALGDSSTVSVKVYSGSTTGGTVAASGTDTADPSGAWALDLSTPLSPGTYTAQATQQDLAGNVGTSPARTFSVTSPTTYPPTDPTVLAAGDIAGCDTNGDEQTANILDAYPSATVLPLGDDVYEQGSLSQFNSCYDPSWGRAKSRSHPVLGNHEYLTTNAAGYFGYFNAQLAPFGAAATDPTRGWYSYDLGAWHIVALNDQCAFVTGGCGSGSPEVQWLQSDLAAHPAQCTLAYMHEPLFSSGSNGSTDDQALWQALYAGGADVVLNGHDHDYERFAPQTPAGALDVNNGITEFVVGTGGRSHFAFNGPFEPNSQVRDNSSFGVIKLDLHAASYTWTFLPVAGATFTDAGSRSCH